MLFAGIPNQVRNDCLNCHPEAGEPFMMICRRIPLNMFKGILRFALNDVGCLQGFRNCLGLLFHTTQSLILFALQILFAMLRATSSFGLRPHSTQNPQVRNDCYYLVLVTLNSFQGLYNIFIGIPRLRYKIFTARSE